MSNVYKKIMIISFILLLALIFWNDVEQRDNYSLENIFPIRQADLPENIKGFLDVLIERAGDIKDQGFGLQSFRLAADDYINSETLLILERYYRENNTLLQNAVKIPDKLVGLSLKELQEISLPWEVKEYNPGELVILYRTFEKIGRMHIGERDGRVAVFYGEQGEEDLVEITTIKVNELPVEEQNSVREGLIINSAEELLSVLDGLISSINKD